MSRLTIDVTPEQHKSLKAMAALEGKTLKQFALERLFPRKAGNQGGGRIITLDEILDKPATEMDERERAAWSNLVAFLDERAAEAVAGNISEKTAQQILAETLGFENGV